MSTGNVNLSFLVKKSSEIRIKGLAWFPNWGCPEWIFVFAVQMHNNQLSFSFSFVRNGRAYQLLLRGACAIKSLPRSCGSLISLCEYLFFKGRNYKHSVSMEKDTDYDMSKDKSDVSNQTQKMVENYSSCTVFQEKQFVVI